MGNLGGKRIKKVVFATFFAGLVIGSVHALVVKQPATSYMVALLYSTFIGILLAIWLAYYFSKIDRLSSVFRKFILIGLSFVLIGFTAHIMVESTLTALMGKEFVLLSKRVLLGTLVSTIFGIYGFLQLKSDKVDELVEDKHSAHKGESLGSKTITVKIRNKIELIDTENIIYMEAEDKYINIYTDEKKYLKNGALSSLTEGLPDDFIQINRSYVVNKRKIVEVYKELRGIYTFVMKNGAKLKSGNTYSKVLRTMLET